jgi:acyl-CoA reductase-like NAD-dependent aldehyde dehydrogenase
MGTGVLVEGVWRNASTGEHESVRSPYSGDVVGEVAIASLADADAVLDDATRGARVWRRTPAHERFAVLMAAAALADQRSEDIAGLISAETGKSMGEARGEAGRTGEIIRLSAFEGSQLYGEGLPLDANKGTGFDKLGFTLPQPLGVVVAITPFNYPALLMLHKVAPALAVGNAVVVKPARQTPLTAIALAQCFIDAGLPPGVLSMVTGAGAQLGNYLVSDPRVDKVSFTGSTAVGETITRVAGVKRLSLELGASSPVIILAGADLDYAAQAVALGGYINAGQVCISVQRIVVEQSIEGAFLDALLPKVEAIRVGDPRGADTMVGSMISEAEAQRVEAAIAGVVSDGATLITGGEREGAVLSPAIVSGVDPEHSFAQEELFGPAVSVSTARDAHHALALANSTRYGLGAGVFTSNVDQAIEAAREVDAGVVHINWTPLWRADLMPYGGVKASGIGKEGVRSTVHEMSERKTVILHGRPWDTAAFDQSEGNKS